MGFIKKIFRSAATIFKWLAIVVGVLSLISVLSFLLFGNSSPQRELLDDAFVLPDIPLQFSAVTYVTKEGKEVSVPAFAGQVEIFTAAETSPDDIKGFVSGHGGKIIAQAPTVGIYIAGVSVGKEAGLIEVLLKEDWVIDAHPYIPLDKNQAEYILDFWKKPSRERSHGAAVCYYVIGQAECTKEILDRCFGNSGCQEAEWPMFYQIIREIKRNEEAPFIIFNLSLGPKADDKNGKPISAAAVEAVYQAYLGMLLQILGHDDLAGVEKTVIVNSAGNDGTDLTSVFQSLSSRKGFSRLVVVGAVTPAGKISSYTNYSRGERDIMYSVGGEKAISMAGKYLTWIGTSFAAPQITCLLNDWLMESPERAMNPQELRNSVFDADAGKDAKRDFQYRYRIDPCLAEESAPTPLPPQSAEEEEILPAPIYTEPTCTSPYDGIWIGNFEESGETKADLSTDDPLFLSPPQKSHRVSFSITFTVKCDTFDKESGSIVMNYNFARVTSNHPAFGCESGCEGTVSFKARPLQGELSLDIRFPNDTGIFTPDSDWIYSPDRGLMTKKHPPADTFSWGSADVEKYECQNRGPYCSRTVPLINWTSSEEMLQNAIIRKQ